MSPMVSVVIPCYNRATKIIRCIDSIVNQTYTNIQIIVVDDGSVDNSVITIQDYILKNGLKNIQLYLKTNGGAPSARNYGFSKVEGKYIVFFDSDDAMLPERIEIQLRYMVENLYDCCVAGFYFNSTEGPIYAPPVVTDFLKSYVSRQLYGSTQSWMYKTDLFIQTGGYDQSLSCYQDLDINLKILSLSPSVGIIQKPLSIFFDGKDNDRIMNNWTSMKSFDSIMRYHIKVIELLVRKNRLELLTIAIKSCVRDIVNSYKSNKALLMQVRKYIKTSLSHIYVKSYFSFISACFYFVFFGIYYLFFTNNNK